MLTIPFRKIAQSSVAICAILFSDPKTSIATPELILYGDGKLSSESIVRLTQCDVNSNCVSSNYREPPNRYVSPLKIVNDRDVAFQRAVKDLKQYPGSDISIVEIVPKDYYIHVTMPGNVPTSLDDLELVYAENIVNIKCEARVKLPPPPFCLKKNCINGNMDQRSKVENIAFILGLPPSDREQMQNAKWTPIFWNSDRVPGFDE